MAKRIYITHCSAKKNNTLRHTKKKVTPDQLYTSQRIQSFIKKCKEKRVPWAIFSDKYGVIFPNDKIQWYEKPPDQVTPEEFKTLLEDFVQKLSKYDEIWFYHHPIRFHKLYKQLINEARKRGLKIVTFTHIDQIE